MNKDILLTELIREVAFNDELNGEKLEEYRKRFETIYDDKYRHEYSEVTRVLFSIEVDEARDYLTEKIKNIRDEIDDKEIKKSVSKLWDHINLENIRIRELNKISNEANEKYSKLKNEYDKLEVNLEKMNEVTKKAQKKLNIIDKNIDNSTTKSITILGIFAGIVMAFSGGLTFIASALQNINAISIYRLVFVVILLSAAIFNIIFMLIYMIGKISGSYIGSKCNCSNQFEGCQYKTNKCAILRYPIVGWFNIAVMLLAFGICGLYIIDKYNLLTRAIERNTFLTIIILIIIFIGIITTIIIGANKLLKIKCEK